MTTITTSEELLTVQASMSANDQRDELTVGCETWGFSYTGHQRGQMSRWPNGRGAICLGGDSQWGEWHEATEPAPGDGTAEDVFAHLILDNPDDDGRVVAYDEDGERVEHYYTEVESRELDAQQLADEVHLNADGGSWREAGYDTPEAAAAVLLGDVPHSDQTVVDMAIALVAAKLEKGWTSTTPSRGSTLFLRDSSDLAKLVQHDRLAPVLVRYRGRTEGRFTAPAQDVGDLVQMLKDTDRYVRDMSA